MATEANSPCHGVEMHLLTVQMASLGHSVPVGSKEHLGIWCVADVQRDISLNSDGELLNLCKETVKHSESSRGGIV